MSSWGIKIRKFHVVRTIEEMRQVNKSLINKHVSFVPTMGALHHGHLTLINKASENSDVVVASIFINPTQFSAGEDLSKYPRTFEKDIELIKDKVDILFAPNDSEIYPSKLLCHVEPSDFNQIYEGKARPEFFRGVATIVCKLFNIVQPQVAFFGQKDISQCILIRRMVQDLNLPVRIHVVETIREKDGLAMSSRNVYLDENERKSASILYRALLTGKHLCEQPKNTILREHVISTIEKVLQSDPFVNRIEYISLASHYDMKEINEIKMDEGAILSSAIRLGKVRLIDNVLIGKAYQDILGIK